MPLISTPRHLRLKAELYHQLGSMLAAGLPLPNAVQSLAANPPSSSLRRALTQLHNELATGLTFAEALQRSPLPLPDFDLALIEAGEKSGRLDECLKMLARYYHQREQLARQTLSHLAYPLFLLHFAVFIIPFPQLFTTGNVAAYLGQTLGILLPLYAISGFILWSCQGQRPLQWRALLERILHTLPLLGSARRQLALARLCAALEALLNAGVSMISAWELAAAASGSPALQRAVSSWRPRLESGCVAPSEALAETRDFPELFTNLYHTGEITGKLDENLLRLHQHYQEEGSRKLRALSEWFPRLVYFGIVFIILNHVFNFWTGYFSGILNHLE